MLSVSSWPRRPRSRAQSVSTSRRPDRCIASGVSDVPRDRPVGTERLVLSVRSLRQRAYSLLSGAWKSRLTGLCGFG